MEPGNVDSHIQMRYEMEILEEIMYYDKRRIISSFPLYIYRTKEKVNSHASALFSNGIPSNISLAKKLAIEQSTEKLRTMMREAVLKISGRQIRGKETIDDGKGKNACRAAVRPR